MDLHINAMSWSLWLGQTLAMTFLVAGFNSYEMHLWRRAHMVAQRNAGIDRVILVLVPVVMGMIMLYVGHNDGARNIELINVGLFILALPLFDERLGRWERLARVGYLLPIWVMTHHGTYTQPKTIIGTVIFASLVAAVLLAPAGFRFRSGLTLAAIVSLGATFWLTIPWGALGIHLTPALLGQAIAMYAIMGAYCTAYWRWMNQRLEDQERMLRLEAYDRLTNEQSYRYSQEDSAKLMAASQKQHKPLTIATLDVDYYGAFNRDYGHLAGNEVLIKVAELLEESLAEFKPQPHIYRSGGEEFNIAFPDTDSDHAEVAIRQCLLRVREHDFKLGASIAKLTLSAGITMARATDTTVDDVFKRADDNLRLCKSRGRDMYTVDGKSSKVATDKEQLAYFAQPIMHLNGDAAASAYDELLLRSYNERKQRWLLPKTFKVGAIEQINLIRQALRAGSCQRVTINLTLAQFSDPDYAYALVGYVKADEEPDELVVEITDVPDLGTMRRISAMYRAANIKIFIDDVGSDNSYELVQNLLPYVDGVKFAIQNLRRDEPFERIQKRIYFWVGVAKQHDLKFILEGVEDASEVAFAQELGIEYFQGYYYAKPALPEA